MIMGGVGGATVTVALAVALVPPVPWQVSVAVYVGYDISGPVEIPDASAGSVVFGVVKVPSVADRVHMPLGTLLTAQLKEDEPPFATAVGFAANDWITGGTVAGATLTLTLLLALAPPVPGHVKVAVYVGVRVR
jgi:hypothetical protein